MRRFTFFTLTSCLASAALAQTGPDCQTSGGGQFYDRLTYCVSSVLPDQSSNDYGAENLTDGDLATAWCEGAPDQGVGQQIVIQITGGTEFDHFYIHNGYQKSSNSYQHNSRPRDVRISSGDGLDMLVELRDQMGQQRVNLERFAAYSQLVIKVLSVYPGSKWADTCVSELHLDFEAQNVQPTPPPGAGGGISIGGGSPGFGNFPKLRNQN